MTLRHEPGRIGHNPTQPVRTPGTEAGATG